jgi:acyl-CoA synthetase (AMP-forming)/AMP-acid ligase II
MPDTAVRIKGGAGEGHLGTVMIRGPQLSPGYWTEGGSIRLNRPPDSDWYTTSDLGFLWKGQLFVLGRADDTIVVNGSNYFATDIAATCAQVPGIRPGRVTAFADDDGPSPSVRLVAEIAHDADPSPRSLSRLARNVRQTLARFSGLHLSGVDFVRPGDLPVTTSGKVRASEVRRRYLANTMSLLSQDATAW